MTAIRSQHADAIMYDNVSYTEVLTKNLKVMDATAISLCRDNGLPLSVFNLQKAGNIKTGDLRRESGNHCRRLKP